MNIRIGTEDGRATTAYADRVKRPARHRPATAYVVLDDGSFVLEYQCTNIDTDHTIGFDIADVKADKEAVLTSDFNPGNDDDTSVA
jgi:hypothetical protein